LCGVCGNMRWSVVTTDHGDLEGQGAAGTPAREAEDPGADQDGARVSLRPLDVDFNALTYALNDHDRGFIEMYFDTLTGDVVDLPTELTDWIEGESDHAMDDDDGEWDADLLAVAQTILEENGPDGEGRYAWIEPRESYEAYDSMVRFAESVEDRELQRLLSVALNGRGAFRRFKDVLYDFPEERERWFAAHNAELLEHAKQWLRTLGIEGRPRHPPPQDP